MIGQGSWVMKTNQRVQKTNEKDLVFRQSIIVGLSVHRADTIQKAHSDGLVPVLQN